MPNFRDVRTGQLPEVVVERGMLTHCGKKSNPSEPYAQSQSGVLNLNRVISSTEGWKVLGAATRLYGGHEALLMRLALLVPEDRAAALRRAPILDSPNAVEEIVKFLGSSPIEFGVVLALDGNKRLLGIREIAGFDQKLYYRNADIVAFVLSVGNASGCVFVHNHPSGILRLSEPDKVGAARLCAALKLLDLELLDYAIVSAGGLYSMHDRGELDGVRARADYMLDKLNA